MGRAEHARESCQRRLPCLAWRVTVPKRMVYEACVEAVRVSLLNLDREIEIGRYYGVPIRLHLYFFVAAVIVTFPWWISFRLPIWYLQ